MKFTTQIKTRIDEKEWDSLLLQNKASTVYQSYNWARLYQEVFGSKPLFIYVKNPTGKIVGQLLAFVHHEYYWIYANHFLKKIGSMLNLGSIILWWYGPIIYAESYQDEIVSEILSTLDKEASENNVIMIRGSSAPMIDQFNQTPFEKKGYTLKLWGTYVTDLQQDINYLYSQLNKKTKYDIRKGEKNNLEFEVASDKRTLDEYIKLKHKERESVGQKTARIPLYKEKYWEYLQKNGYEKLFIVRHKGELIGGILNIIFNNNIIQHGVLNLRKELVGGPFLTWNTIKWASKEKYRTYDMGGFNPFPESEKERSIDFYKSKWAGKKLHYNTYTKVLDRTKFKLATALIYPERTTRKIKKIISKK